MRLRTGSMGRGTNRLDGVGVSFRVFTLTVANKTPSGHPDPSNRFGLVAVSRVGVENVRSREGRI